MWRARIQAGAPAVGEACGNVDARVAVTGGAVAAGVERVAAVLGPRWYGCGVPEVYVPSRVGRISADARYYWRTWRGGDTLYPAEGCPEVLVVGPEVALDQVAGEIGLARTLALALELCGTYTCHPDLDRAMKLNMAPALSAARVRRYVEVCGRFCSSVLKEASEYVVDGCASVMEAKVLAAMAIPENVGGFGLPLPEVNAEVLLGEDQVRMCKTAALHPDFLWRREGLALEYDSNAWHFDVDQAGSRSRRDRRRSDAMTSMGITVRTLTAGTFYDYRALGPFMDSLRVVLKGRKSRIDDVGRKRRERFCADIAFMQDPLSGIYDSRPYRTRFESKAYPAAAM
jgi:hypothetical protein